MGHPEGVVDVGVVPVDQLLDERRVVRLLARVEAEVLQQLDLGRQPRQLLADRAEVPPGVRCPLRAGPRWVQAVTLAPRSMRYSSVGQGGPDAEVVGDRRTARRRTAAAAR